MTKDEAMKRVGESAVDEVETFANVLERAKSLGKASADELRTIARAKRSTANALDVLASFAIEGAT